MPNAFLPEYPAIRDLYDDLKAETRPIVVYGMGNGADKLLSRLSARGITVSDFFASDGFVRGQTFHGKKVLSFSEIREKYDDFRILLSFASDKPDVMEQIFRMDREYGIIMPDLPVVGDGEFTKEYYNDHYAEFCDVCEMFADDASKILFGNVLRYKLTGKISYLTDTVAEGEIRALLGFPEIRCALDVGAYNGDTARDMIAASDRVLRVYAIEADRRNYQKLEDYSKAEDKIKPIYAAAFDHTGTAEFAGSGNRNSSLENASFRSRKETVPLLPIDKIEHELPFDTIKFDVEGAEREALLGARETVTNDRPTLSIAIYHRNEDVYTIPFLLKNMCSNYNFYCRRTAVLPAWELRLIAVPFEIERG